MKNLRERTPEVRLVVASEAVQEVGPEVKAILERLPRFAVPAPKEASTS